jgi:hypothetical protein
MLIILHAQLVLLEEMEWMAEPIGWRPVVNEDLPAQIRELKAKLAARDAAQEAEKRKKADARLAAREAELRRAS